MHSMRFPPETIRKWQEIVDLLAEIAHVPLALIMQVEAPDIRVFVSSETEGNPYEATETAPLNTGLYCETVMQNQRPLLVADALSDEAWKSNPDIKRGMISYLGLPISWPDGEIFGTICVLDKKRNSYSDAFIRLLTLWRDVLEADLRILVTMEKQIEDRESRIQRLFDADIIGIFMWADTVIVEANDEFLRIIGYDYDDLATGRLRWTELTPPEWYEFDVRQWMPALRLAGSVQSFEKEYFRKDGSRVPVLVGVACFDKGGNEGVATVLDLTERKRAEAKARATERKYCESQTALAHANRVITIGQLTASISHEIKQPISACVTNADAGLHWLNRHPPNLEEAREAFQRIRREAERASEVMNRVRSLAKKAPVQREQVQINEAVREVIDLTRSEAKKSSVSVQMDLADNLPPVLGDRVQLQQAMLNLVINAIEAMNASEGQRELTVVTSMEECGGVAITVRDSGPGVAPENMERLFESFYTTKPNGMGMGLSICQSIVEAHGGTLRQGPNKPHGAVFQFVVPLTC